MLFRYFSREYIRNFCIIAHIDHGKSTLADRFLELTGSKVNKTQVLDKLAVERERGITIHAQSVTMDYFCNSKTYTLNLIDTPGHVDFSYEVSRSLRACQGAILLVDGISGIQAQTYSTFFQAKQAGLSIIPVINKIDSPAAIPDHVAEQVENQFGLLNPFFVSAKTGKGVKELLDSVVTTIPEPPGSELKSFRGFLFDSWFDKHKGVICLIEVVDGKISKNDIVVSFHTKKQYKVESLGLHRLELEYKESLTSGQVGFIILGMKEASEALIGDTFYLQNHPDIQEFPGFQQPKCMVYAGVYPEDSEEYEDLLKSIQKYQLEDRSLTVQKDMSPALGSGFRCGFLGMLHMDIFKERIEKEHDIGMIVTSPSVPYKFVLKGNATVTISNPTESPEKSLIKACYEPMTLVTIFFPTEYLGEIIQFCMGLRGTQESIDVLDEKSTILKFKLPLSEIITDFYSNLKSLTRGMATVDYEHSDYNETDIGLMHILINKEKVDALMYFVHKIRAYDKGKAVVQKLKNYLPAQMVDIAIQASFGGKIIARETVKAYRKDVTAKLYGGDQTRRDKLLEKQKKGKKKMKMLGIVKVDPNTFQKIIREQ